MIPEDFTVLYEKALASQDWELVNPLMTEEVSVTFSTGAVHQGKEKVQAAFEHNFKMIKSEKYAMSNIRWTKKTDTYAVFLFEYEWSGYINGNLLGGKGIGTSVIIYEDGHWKLLSEHLGKV